MEHLIDKILEIHRLATEIDNEVTTCNLGAGDVPKWHMLEYDAFIKAAESLGETPVFRPSHDRTCYDGEYVFYHRGVRVFCLCRRKTHDSTTTN